MSDSLFGGDDVPAAAAQAPETTPGTIADWQVAQLRKALDARQLAAMDDRQRLVEQLVGRPVSSLRDLTSAEARALSESLASVAARSDAKSDSSSWDERDEDTWIDRL